MAQFDGELGLNRKRLVHLAEKSMGMPKYTVFENEACDFFRAQSKQQIIWGMVINGFLEKPLNGEQNTRS